MELTPRERDILLKVVELYMETGEPVGSRTLQKRYSMKVSPATIRNVMADLEDKKLLFQPHTSAGRIPTDEGLKIYINHLLFSLGETDLELTNRLINYIQSTGTKDLNEIFSSVLNFLTNITGHTSLGVNFAIKALKIKEISLIKLSKNKVLTVITCEPEYIIHEILDVEANTEFLTKLSRELTKKFANKKLSFLKEELAKEINKVREEFQELSFKLKSQIIKMVNDTNELKISGTTNIINVVSDDIEKLKETIKVLEEKQKLLETFEKLINTTERTAVLLGTETELEEFEPFSIVISKYSIYSEDAGIVGIVGPKRMDYSKIIPVVENVSVALSQILNSL